jgi:CheY-like chemotaxis protein
LCLLKILVVDDDASICASVRLNLTRKLGADVEEATDGQAAIAILLRQRYDLLLLDVHMPGIDGIRLLRAIRRSPACQTLPVVMLTGSADDSLVAETLSLKVADYLVKPVAPATLVNRLAAVLARRSTASLLSGTSAGILTLRKDDRLLVVEADLAYREFVAGQLAAYCQVEQASSHTRGLQACMQGGLTAIFLGDPDDIPSQTIFLAQVHTSPGVGNVPVFGLVPPDQVRTGRHDIGFDGLVPRTLAEDEWRAAMQPLIRVVNE